MPIIPYVSSFSNILIWSLSFQPKEEPSLSLWIAICLSYDGSVNIRTLQLVHHTQIYFLPYASSCFAYLVCMLGTSIFPLFFFSLSLFDDEINFRNPSSAKTFQIQLVPYSELQIMVLSEDFDKWRSMFYLVYWHFSQFLFFYSPFLAFAPSFPFTLCLLQKPSCCTYT